jgi:hypothetical protein
MRGGISDRLLPRGPAGPPGQREPPAVLNAGGVIGLGMAKPTSARPCRGAAAARSQQVTAVEAVTMCVSAM